MTTQRQKNFSSARHGQYDRLGREAGKRFATQLFWDEGWEIIDNPDTFGVDLIARDIIDKTSKACIEVQVRPDWQDEQFLRLVLEKKLQVVCNKGKYADQTIPSYLFTFRLDGRAVLISVIAEIIKCEIRKVPNYVQPDGEEEFYMVPMSSLAHLSEKDLVQELS